MLFLLGFSAYSHLLLSQTKPNQSLYIARELSEKAKLNTILDTKEREQMAGKFAANNAQDIINVLSDPATQDIEEITKLSNRLNEEIKTVKNTIAKVEKPVVQNIDTPVAIEEVFSASSEKDENGISLSETPKVETSSTSSVQELIKICLK
jgi:phage repressor protein C with HTH and peptisase S24 domain